MRSRLDDVFVNHESLIFRRGRIAPETFSLPFLADYYKDPARYGWFLVKNHWLRRGAPTVACATWPIDTLSNNYYHWIADCLPRLLRTEAADAGVNTILLPRHYRNLAFVPFTLRAFPHFRTGWIPDRQKLRVRELLVPEREPANRAELREVVGRVSALADPAGSGRRLYFPRGDLARRRALNEADVIPVMRSYGFEVVHIDPADPAAQIRMSRASDVVAGVHGAALTNLIFMTPGSTVLELRHGHDIFPPIYAALAEAMDISYQPVICELAHEATGWDINHADLTVDIDRLREALDRLP